MDFFGEIDSRNRTCALLFALFAVALTLFVIAASAAIVGGLIVFSSVEGGDWLTAPADRNASFIILGVFLLCGLLLCTLHRYHVYQTNTESLVVSLGARLADVQQPLELLYQNVVEEIAIAAGVPAPIAVVLPRELAINAFAMVSSDGEAIVGVTYGALANLERGELQAVVAHEFGHLLANDVRDNVLLLSMISGVELLFHLGAYICDFGSGAFAIARPTAHSLKDRSFSSPKGLSVPLPLKPAIVIIGLPLCIVGMIGMVCSSLLRLGISRQREFRADALAVQLTREAQPLANALRKIAELSRGGLITAPGAALCNHYFFVAASNKFLLRLTATHPPLADRIANLAQEDGSCLETTRTTSSNAITRQHTPPSLALMRLQAAEIAAPRELINLVLEPSFVNLGTVRALLSSIPQWLRAECHSCVGAQVVAISLLLVERSADLDVLPLPGSLDPWQKDRIRTTIPALAALPLVCRLPLLDCASMALLMLPPAGRGEFLKLLEELLTPESSPFSVALYLLLESRLDSPRTAKSLTQAEERQAMTATVIHFLSLSRSSGDDVLLRKSIESARQELGEFAVAPGSKDWLESEDLEIANFAEERPETASFIQALRALRSLDSINKRRLLRALCVGCTADGHVSVLEMELLRAVAAQLTIGVPPFEDLLEAMYQKTKETNHCPQIAVEDVLP